MLAFMYGMELMWYPQIEVLYSHTLGIEYVCINGNSFTTGCSEHIAQFDEVKTILMHYDCDS